jgi:hypothetical protein
VFKPAFYFSLMNIHDWSKKKQRRALLPAVVPVFIARVKALDAPTFSNNPEP